MVLTGESEVLGEKSVIAILCIGEILNGLDGHRTRASDGRYRQIIARAMARLIKKIHLKCTEVQFLPRRKHGMSSLQRMAG